MKNQLHIHSVLADLELNETSIDTSDILLSVYDIFEKNKSIPGLLLLTNGQFFGVLSRVKFFEMMSRQFMYDVFSKRRVDYFFDKDSSSDYLILNSSTSVIMATNEALKRKGTEIFEPIIVAFGENTYRLLDFYQLLVAQNKIQLMMNDMLKKANEFKKEVLAIVSHDLRNPIGTILGFSNLIIDVEHIDKSKEFALYINKSAAQMMDLVNGFLGSAINDSIEFELEYTHFDVIDLLQSVIKSFEQAAQKKRQIIHFTCDSNQLIISSDRLKIKEIVENLISNALKFSEKDTEIHVFFHNDRQFFEIMVQDQGVGFTETDLLNVFSKFQRLSAKPTDNESSIGLGLFITKMIVDKLKGTIILDSEPDKGSTFTVKLPKSIEI